MNRKAIIFGIRSYKLTSKEKYLLKNARPWGIILFSRNIKNISQLKSLVQSIKKIFKDKKYPILIDQENGNVSRLNKLIDLSFFSQKLFGQLYERDKILFNNIYKVYINKVCDIFKKVGININTVPVLDVLKKNSHKIIKNRSYSNNPNKVSKLGKICIDLFEKNNIATVIKHIPGHGSADQDSHFNTPIISSSKEFLKKNEFLPFKKNKSLFGMTAHIIYKSYDLNSTATHSSIIINKVVRDYIGFNGILMSDDISMKSLKYNIEENAIKALKAGCNLVLHCNANINEMTKLSKVVPKIDNFTKKKTSHFYKFLM